MTFELVLALIAAAVGVALGLLAIHHWGPRRTRNWVHCPEKNVDARITVERKEGSFAALLPPDVASCSLLPEGDVTCEKKCLRA